MLCPRCNKHTLDERERDGITIDICQECRGIRLDRGERERLTSRTSREMQRQAGCAHSDGYRGGRDRYHDHHEHHSHDHRRRHEGSQSRKRHWLAELFD